MKWQQISERPIPPEWFTRELKKIDPELRAVWALERYLKETWAIERKCSAERYWTMYNAVMESKFPRFIDQPVFDDAQPIKDEFGQTIGHVQVGTRQLDLAPEYEWIHFSETLDQKLLDSIKKLYWEHNHSAEAAAALQTEQEARDEAQRAKRIDAAVDGIPEALLETRKVVQFGHGAKRNET